MLLKKAQLSRLKMPKVYWMWCLLLLMSCLTVTAGCSHTRIVYAGYGKPLEGSNGALRIATNEKVSVTVVGVNDVEKEMDLGGMFAVSKPDLKAFFEAVEYMRTHKCD